MWEFGLDSSSIGWHQVTGSCEHGNEPLKKRQEMSWSASDLWAQQELYNISSSK
jgi:hypothetical protein